MAVATSPNGAAMNRQLPEDPSVSTLLASSLSTTGSRPCSGQRQQSYRTVKPQKLDTTSPPVREKTRTPTSGESRLHNAHVLHVLGSSSTSPPEGVDFWHGSSSPDARENPGAGATPSRSTSVDAIRFTPKENRNGKRLTVSAFSNGSGITSSESTAKRDWARRLQRCLLDREKEVREFRCRAEMREREVAIAEEEIKRLHGVISLQKHRIDELTHSLVQAEMTSSVAGVITASSHSKRSGGQRWLVSNGRSEAVGEVLERASGRGVAEALDGLSVSEVKSAVRSAVSGLARMEEQLRTQKALNRSLREENDALRRQLALSSKGGHDSNGRCETRSCTEEVHEMAMAFLRGPFRRFLSESEQLKIRMQECPQEGMRTRGQSSSTSRGS
ncbi:uncharacterized protein TEOVI_000235600 [Trypanosoma equiperdum]|uniref:Uncharacterized protein n=2 Tax=Trypanozoon TaxID=39700 RepID=Q384Z0_TRYB2|nr:hypothetical protein, conserved [Trypanosoma brucei brucei TREU927]EAN79641.1 hypothetical protein, conserved [Trypanosoma brucei brucei TREU927]SCU70781.1 hypothetical protein, conserved [Trypanosoma equiperdum]